MRVPLLCGAGLILLLLPGGASSQPLLLKAESHEAASIAAAKTHASTTAVQKMPVALSAEVIAAVLMDTLQPSDGESLKAALTALYQSQKDNLVIAILSGGNIRKAGPFRSKAQFQAGLREIGAPVPRSAAPGKMYSLVADTAGQFAAAWRSLVLVGRFPDIESEVREYAIAWLSGRLREHRVRASFLALGGERPAFLAAVSRLTGGATQFESVSELAVSLGSATPRIELSWPPPSAPAGFHLHRVQLVRQDGELVLEVPSIAAAGGKPAPDIDRYAELRTRIAAARKLLEAGQPEQREQARQELQQALDINPADPDALRLAADLYARAKDLKNAAVFLALLAEADPENAALAAELGAARFAAGDLDAAEIALSRARELGASTALLYEQLGRIRLARNQASGALSAFERSLQLDPKNQVLWFLQAETANKFRDAARETEALERGLALGGVHLPRRTALIRLYLARDRNADALKQIDTVLPGLPAEAATQRDYAGFLEKLGRPDDALRLWKKAIELDPAGEEAHLAAGRLLLAKNDFAAANAAADAGLAGAPNSGRLYALKADALAGLGDINQSRAVLKRGLRAAQEPALLQRAAAVEDLYGSDAADLYASLATVLEQSSPKSAEHLRILRRGLEVSIRDRNQDRAAWFSSRLRALGENEFLVRVVQPEAPSDVIWVQGGLEALAFIAHGKPKSPPALFLSEYCRALVRNTDFGGKKDSEAYVEGLRDYFTRLADIAGTGRHNENRIAITLSLAGKNKRRETERILGLLGWKMQVSRQKVTIEAGEKAVQGRRQETSSALAIDEIAMQEALQGGKPFQFEIPFEAASVVLGEKAWRSEFYPKEDLPGGLPEALARDTRLARLYIALDTMDPKTAAALVQTVGLKTLAEKYFALLYRYSPALVIEGGALVLPGGARSEKVWTGLAGASPGEPAKFLRALLEKDDGRLLAFFSSLAQLDVAHQKFFTSSASRAGKFYELFRESPEMDRGAELLLRDGPFTELLREVPLDSDGRVAFPGAPEVWMVVKGSGSVAATGKRIRKLAKVAAPEVEDDILLRLARTRYKAQKERRSELDNFLTVVRIDAHRAEPLDEASALLLSENYARYPGAYPYFAVLTGLGRSDFESFFAWAEKLSGADRVRANAILGQWHSLVALICLARQAGQIGENESTELFRLVSSRFQKAAAPAEYVSASLDVVRALLSAAKAGDGADEGLRNVLVGTPRPVEFEVNSKTVHMLAGERRRADYDRVLEMQKATSLDALLRTEEACRRLAAGQGPAASLIDMIDSQRPALLRVEIPKTLKIEGKQKDDLEAYRPESVQRLVARLREKTAKKKVNQKDIAKLASEVLEAIEPQTRVALLAPVYAHFLSPDDLLLEDPLFLRKHQFVPLSGDGYLVFGTSRIEGSSEGVGRYLTGGLAEFGHTAGEIASVSVRNADVNSSHAVGAQFAAVRTADYRQLRDDDLHLLALTVRAAREWILRAAGDPGLRPALLESTQGLLSLTRRRALFAALDARDWPEAWAAVTLSDLYFLGRKYLERFPTDPFESPVLMALRTAAARNDGSRLHLLGGALPETYNCTHPHLLEQAPYEEFERFLLPTRLAERVGEFKLYLAEAMTSQGVPAAAIDSLAEPALRETVKQMRMTDLRDWRSAIAALSTMNGRTLVEVLEQQ